MENTINELFETAANNVQKVYDAGYTAGQTVKQYSIMLVGYYYDSTYNTIGTQETIFVIDSCGNFIIDIGSLDNFATEHNLSGFHVLDITGKLSEELAKYFTKWRKFGAIMAYSENGLWNTPAAFGCGITPFEEGAYDITISSQGISVPIGVYGTIQGKLFETIT